MAALNYFAKPFHLKSEKKKMIILYQIWPNSLEQF